MTDDMRPFVAEMKREPSELETLRARVASLEAENADLLREMMAVSSRLNRCITRAALQRDPEQLPDKKEATP